MPPYNVYTDNLYTPVTDTKLMGVQDFYSPQKVLELDSIRAQNELRELAVQEAILKERRRQDIAKIGQINIRDRQSVDKAQNVLLSTGDVKSALDLEKSYADNKFNEARILESEARKSAQEALEVQRLISSEAIKQRSNQPILRNVDGDLIGVYPTGEVKSLYTSPKETKKSKDKNIDFYDTTSGRLLRVKESDLDTLSRIYRENDALTNSNNSRRFVDPKELMKKPPPPKDDFMDRFFTEEQSTPISDKQQRSTPPPGAKVYVGKRIEQ